jgi:cell wall-associated NlpC family hydrolase
LAFIDDLTEKSTTNGSDYLIIEDNESTKKIQLKNLLSKQPIDIKMNENNKIYLIASDGTQIGDGTTLALSSGEAKQIEMVFDGVWVKWRYKGDENWINLFSVADIGGSSGGGGGSNPPSNTDVEFRIGTVTTLPAGSDATAVIEEPTDNSFVLSLGLPRGEAVTVDGDGVDVSNQIKTNTDKTSSKVSIIVRTNNRYVYGTLSSLTLLTNTAEKELPDYNVAVTFRTQDNTPMKFSQSTNLYMVGDDCLFGAFIPRVSTDYRIEIAYGGTRLIGKVYGANYGYVATLSNFTGGGNIVGVAKSYIDNATSFCYGTTTILSSVTAKSEVTDSTGKFYIDCSTLTSLSYRGILYSDSKYNDWTKTNSARTSKYSYAIELPRTAAEQARYCIEKGWILPKEYWGDNYNLLQAGDLVFYSERPVGKVSAWGTRFMRVGHVALVTGIEEGIAYLYEATSGTAVNGLRKISILDNTPEKICMIARPQLTVGSSGGQDGWDIEDDPSNPSENMLENGGISTSTGNNTQSSTYVRNMGYIHLGDVKGIKLSVSNKDIIIANVFYYDDNDKMISYEGVGGSSYNKSIPTGAKKFRFTFRRADNSALNYYEVNYDISYVMNENINIKPTPSEMGFRDFPRVTGKINNQYKLVAKLNEIVEDYDTCYVYGAVGQHLTASLISTLADRWRSMNFYTQSKLNQYEKIMADAKKKNKYIWGFDCVNVIKAVLWGWNGDQSKSYGGATYGSNGVSDVSADGCISICKNVKSYWDKNNNPIPWDDIQLGEAVWTNGHIGIYVGEGLVIECTPKSGTGWTNNVQISGLGNLPFNKTYSSKKRTWKKHGKLPWITYLDECPWTKTEDGQVVELKGKAYKASISTYYPTTATVNTSSKSEATKILKDLNMGKGLTYSNYKNAIKWQSLVDEIAPKFGVDPTVAIMIIAAESGGDPNQKTGSNGGYGLMQCERSVYIKGFKNPNTGKTNSGVHTIKYLDGTTKKVTLSMTTMDGNTESGRRLQVEFGCHELRDRARNYYWNIIHSLVAYNMGAGAFNLICSKYICEKYGYELIRSGSLSKQSSQVQKKVKEMLKQGDLGYLKYRKWYTTTGHNYLNAGPGTANNVELYLQYYKSVNGQLPYFYDDDNKKLNFEDVVLTSGQPTTTTELIDAMGNKCIGYPTELICSAPEGIPLGSKVFIQGTGSDLDGKIFTVVDRCDELNNSLNIKLCMENKATANAYDEMIGNVLVGDIVTDGKIVVTTAGVNIRSGTSTSYDKVGHAVKDCHFTWIKTFKNGWHKVDFKGKECYMSGTYSKVKEVG